MERGTPILNIGFASIVRECSLDDNASQHFINLNQSSYHNIHDVFHYRKFQDDFGDFLTLHYYDDKHLGLFQPSYDEFITKIACFLNTGLIIPICDDEDFERVCDERIHVLENISSEEELKLEFPFIYRDLMEGRKYMNDIRDMKEVMSFDEYKEAEHYYYSCALQYSFKNFLPKQVELYKRFVHQRREYLDKIRKKNCNRYLQEHFDMNKLAMLVMANYLEIAENSDDVDYIRQWLELIQQYLDGNYSYEGSVCTDSEYTVTIDDIVERYYVLQYKIQPKIEFVNWELVPEGTETLFPVEGKQSPRQIQMSSEKAARLRKMGKEKMELYHDSGFIARVVGTMENRGYIAYLYANGEVILDRVYNPDSVSTASGNAIYHMKAKDFLELSQLDKSALTAHPKVERIIHSKYWKERVQKIFTEPGSVEDQEAAKVLRKELEARKK